MNCKVPPAQTSLGAQPGLSALSRYEVPVAETQSLTIG